jgi:cyclic-di-AMP phosphodiesterase PgpH
LNPEDFSYNGNPPTTRESAVVMLADTVEAACRTLENPSVSRLDKFIQGLINAKIEHGQLDNCSLTFRDVSKVKTAFVQILAGYYHSRIEYPDQKDPDAKEITQVEKNMKSDKPEKKEKKNG